MKSLKTRGMSKVKQIMLMPLVLIIKALGVDYRHFSTLLNAKVKIDFRRPPNSFQSGGKKQTFIKQLFVYSILGVVMIVSLNHIQDFKLQLSVFFSFVIVFVGTILLTEFTSVLFDEKENHILLPRPVSSRTLLLVRLVHILLYVSLIALGLSLPFMVYVGIFHGFSMLPFLLAVLLCAYFTLIASTGFYMLLSKFVSVERFKDVLNYFQIGLAIVIMASYQLVPNMIEGVNPQDLTFKAEWWTYLVPSVWFAGLTQFISGMGDSMDMVLAIIVLLVLVMGSYLLIRTLSDGFSSIIAEAGTGTQEKKVTTIKTGGLKDRLKALVCISETEQAGWAFTMHHVKNDRKLKQQIYPVFAYSLIMAIVFLKPDFQNLSQFYIELGESSKYLMFILAGFFGTVAISIIPYTEFPAATWIYDMASTKQKYHIQSGAVKALLFTFYLPLNIFYLLLVIWIWGLTVVPYIILGTGLTAVLSILLVRMQANPLPFSKAREMINKGEHTLKMFLGMFLIGVIIGLVYLLSLVHLSVVIVLCLLLPIAISMSYRYIRNRQ